MLPQLVIDRINSLQSLEGSVRVREENPLINLVLKELINPELEESSWNLLRDLAQNFVAPYNRALA